MEFDEVREYAVGDDARLIDWNVTSRIGSPFTKVFREERELHLVLVVDVSGSLLSGDGAPPRTGRVDRRHSLAHAAHLAGDPVSAYLFSDRRETLAAGAARARPSAAHRRRGCWPSNRPGAAPDLAGALRGVAGVLHRRSTCVLVSDFRTTGFWPQLALLRRRHEVVAVRVADAGDRRVPGGGRGGCTGSGVGARRLGRPAGRGGSAPPMPPYWQDHYAEDPCRLPGTRRRTCWRSAPAKIPASLWPRSSAAAAAARAAHQC